MSISSAVRAALRNFAELEETITYRESADPASYDPSTGVLTRSPTPRIIRGIFVEFKQSEVDGEVVQTQDIKVVITSDQFGTYTPKLSDVIVRDDGRVWNVVRIKGNEPVGAFYVFQVRR